MRRTPPKTDVFEARRAWGALLLLALNAKGETSAWLAAEVGYKVAGSMRQVINGHQGVSREVYDKILKCVPEMQRYPAPPIRAVRRGRGSPGPHKKHVYPKIGPVASREATLVNALEAGPPAGQKRRPRRRR